MGAKLLRLILICFIFGLCGCNGGFKSSSFDSPTVNSAAAAPPTNPTAGNQWHAVSLASSSCSGTYQISANGNAMVMTIFADASGKFSGIVSAAGQDNQSISGTCSNGHMNFTIASQKYSGTYGN